MTSRQRLLVAMAGRKADRVPATPDISCMVPVRLSGRTYFDVFIHDDPPLWEAYLAAVRHFGIDGWFAYGSVCPTTRDVTQTGRWLVDEPDRKVREITHHTPEGPLTEQFLYTLDKPPLRVKKLVEDPVRDLPKLHCLFGPIASCDTRLLNTQREALGQLGILGINLPAPGFHIWNEYVVGGIQTLSYLEADRPALLEALAEVCHERAMQELGLILEAGVDFVLTGGSGSITLASPALWEKYSLPTLKAVCDRCRDAGVPSMVHSCGKQRHMIEVCAGQTSLNCINPLEPPPMGDVTLQEARRLVAGSDLTLMGNLHTTDVMLLGTPEAVRSASRTAIQDAGTDGGFILSTGDQCGWDTPDENIFAMVDAAETYGNYGPESA